jgi:phosphohistidine phosphatase
VTADSATRRLLLLRHGKAESPPGVADRDRPLAKRGRRQSEYAGAECRQRDLVPDLVVVSPSLRTRETWDAFAEGLQSELEVDIDPRIYANTVDDVLDVLSEIPEETRTVLLVGHNPSIEAVAGALDHDSARGTDTSLADGFPTGTLAVFEVDASWHQLTTAPDRMHSRAHLREVIRRPR